VVYETVALPLSYIGACNSRRRMPSNSARNRPPLYKWTSPDASPTHTVQRSAAAARASNTRCVGR
jgi:hypothetical protein